MVVTTGQLAKQLEQSSILTADQLVAIREQSGLTDDTASGALFAKQLVKQGQLTKFQAQLAYGGKAKALVMGSYVILDKLGEGGMGQVYKARHKRMKREVALKVLAPQFVKDEGALQRFHREVEAAARLTHQNIVTAFDADESRGTHYLVMEYVRGSDLSQIIKKSGPLSVGQAVNCVLQAATGLAYAHGQGVVHRDIKPSNLLYVPSAQTDTAGTVKILDMGLARFDEGDADKAAALTGTGMLMGTIDYMAPEQAMDSKTADHRADIYSLGATLYYLITGQPMYSADTIMKRIMAHQSAEIPDLPVDDETLQALFARMVAKKVDDRIEPAQLVVSELEAWLSRNKGSATAARIHGRSDSAAADQLGETVIKPADDTSPTSSEFQATVVPHKSATQPKRKPKPAKTDAQSTLSEVVVNVDAEAGTVRPSSRRTARERRRKLNSNPKSRSKQTASGSGGLFANRKLLMAGGGGLAALLLLSVIIFRFYGKDGTVVVELEGDPKVSAVEIDGREVSFTPAGSDKQVTFKVASGSHKLSLKTADGVELTTDLGAKPLEIKAGGNSTLRAWLEAKPDSNAIIAAKDDRELVKWLQSHEVKAITLTIADENRKEQSIEGQSPLPEGNIRLLDVSLNAAADSELFSDETLRKLGTAEYVRNFSFRTADDVPSEITDTGIAWIPQWPSAQRGRLESVGVFAGKGVTDESVNSLNKIHSLLWIVIHNSAISDSGLKQLDLPKLQRVGLPDSAVTPAGFEGLANRSPNITLIELWSCKGLNDTTADLRPFAQWGAQLKVLDLRGSQLNDAALLSFDTQKFAGKLALNDSSITDSGVRAIATPNRIETVDLDYTKVGDNALDALAKWSDLKSVKLSGTQVTEAGVRGLQAALPNCKIESDFGDLITATEAAAAEPSAPKFPRPKYDPSPLPKIGTWEPTGTADVWVAFPGGKIGDAESLPGLAMRPAKLPGIRRWNVDTRQPRGEAPAAEFSPDGLSLAVGARDGHVRIFDTKTMELKQLLPAHASYYGASAISWHPDGQRLAVSSPNGNKLTLWTVDGQMLHESNRQYMTPGYSPDGTMLVTAQASSISLHDIDGNVLKVLSHPKANNVEISGSLTWSPDSQYFATVHADKTLRIWTRAGELHAEADGFGKFSHRGYAVDWSPNGKWIGILDETKRNEIQRISVDGTRGTSIKVDGDPRRFQWSADGTQVVLRMRSELKIVDADSGRVVRSVPNPMKNSASCTIAISPTGDRIAAVSNDIAVFDASLKPLNVFKLQCPDMSSVSWRPDGSSFLTTDDFTATLWNSNGQRIAQIPDAEKVAWHPDGRTIATQGRINHVLSVGDPLEDLEIIARGCRYGSLQFSHHGQYLFGLEAKAAFVIDKSGRVVKKFDPPEGGEVRASFSPVANALAVCAGNEVFIATQQNDWQLERQLKLDRPAYYPSWSPNGRYLAIDETGVFAVQGETFKLVSEFGAGKIETWNPTSALAIHHAGDSTPRLMDVKTGQFVKQHYQREGLTDADWHPSRDMFTVAQNQSLITTWDADAFEPYWRTVVLSDSEYVTMTAAGQIMHGDRATVDKHLVYYIENDEGRIEMLTPTQFEKRIGQSLYIPEQPEPLVESASPVAAVEPDKPAEAEPKAKTTVKEKPAATTPDVAVATTPFTARAFGGLAPLELRMQPRSKNLPKFRTNLRAGQPLGEFAAISRPGKVKDIISWSIEPVLHRGSFRSIDVCEDGVIATGGYDGAIRLWTNDWQLIRVMPGHANSINWVQFSPDGKMLASVSSSPRDMLAVWDVDSGQLLKFHDVVNWQGHLAWTPDGAQILHSSQSGPELIEPLTGQRTVSHDEANKTQRGSSIAFSPNGDRFVMGGGGTHLYDRTTLGIVKTLENDGGNSVDWSGDGKWIAIGKSSGVDILDTRSFQKRHKLDAIGFAQFSPDSTAVAVTANGVLAVFQTSDWTERFKIQAGVGFYEFTWTSDSLAIVTPSGMYDAVTGKQISAHNHRAIPEVATAVSDDGKQVATATSSRMRIFDGDQGTLLHEYSIPKMDNNQLIWQPQGKLILRVDRRAEDNPERLTLIDSESGKTAHQLIGHDEEIFWACWSPDGKQVASVGNDGTCRIWDAATGKQVRSLVHDDPLWWVVWDPSGARIATGSSFGAITVWKAKDGERLREFKTLSQPLPKPTLQKATDTPFAFLKNPNQIFYMAGSSFEMLDVSTGQITPLGKASIPGGGRLSIGWSPDFKTMGLYCGYGEFHLIKQGEDTSFDVRYFRSPHWLAEDSLLLGGDNSGAWVSGYDYRRHRRLGVSFPELPQSAWATLGSDGHYVGSEGIESHIVVVAMHEDGRLMTLTPAEFSEHFGWKNNSSKVKFIK